MTGRRTAAYIAAIPALGMVAGLLSGCRLAATAVVAVLGVVGLAGYGVYKAGDYAVTGVGSAAGATGRAVSTGSKSVGTVVFSGGEFSTEYPFDVKRVRAAGEAAFRKANFKNVSGQNDALSGRITAQTWNGADVTLRLVSAGSERTDARIRVGVRGDLSMSETIHDLILKELDARAATTAGTAAAGGQP